MSTSLRRNGAGIELKAFYLAIERALTDAQRLRDDMQVVVVVAQQGVDMTGLGIRQRLRRIRLDSSLRVLHGDQICCSIGMRETVCLVDPERVVDLVKSQPRKFLFLSDSRLKVISGRLSPPEDLPKVEDAIESLPVLMR